PRVNPLRPASSIKVPAVRGPPGFLNTEPQHGWSNGVPALRQRSSFPCSSFSLAGGPSISASLASSTITVPRFDARYLYEICLRGSGLILPFASITVTSVTRSEEHSLNSSHVSISYAVFCLKKKKINILDSTLISLY